MFDSNFLESTSRRKFLVFFGLFCFGGFVHSRISTETGLNCPSALVGLDANRCYVLDKNLGCTQRVARNSGA